MPAVQITDRPRFGWRGVLLDCCRHFMDVVTIERLLDLMYELPSREDVKRCQITAGAINGQSAPILYGDEGIILDDPTTELDKAA